MKTAVIEPPAVPLERSWTMADLAQLVKARLTFLVLVTTAVGFYAGWQGAMDFVALMHAVLGTALAAAGAAALNQWWEHKFDAIMVRTQMRPIPSGRMLPREGLIVGTALSVGGVIYLALAVNFISAILAAATIGIYLFAYTPLKRISTSKHAGRRDPRRVATVDRMGGGTQTISPFRPGRFSRFSFSGSCRIFSPSAGCIARIMSGPASSCSRVVTWKAREPAGRAFSSPCCCSLRA